MSTREEFDEERENGLIFADRYIPGELLTQIFTYVDHKSLLSCQLVCKRWEMLIKSYVWRKVAELAYNDEIMLTFNFNETITGETQNQWHRVMHTFTNYRPGLWKIIYSHGGVDKSFWSGHYGSKMAGACVCVHFPVALHFDGEDDCKEDVL
ncbi:uncharacterized protein LOC143208956 [Lasioglossum baleicum]|uniref:uncharacterized protein LOC143208956 n=1 Tax=Lasioglossum baleicum TaxID=434251 RepID=UPI003FCCEB56